MNRYTSYFKGFSKPVLKATFSTVHKGSTIKFVKKFTALFPALLSFGSAVVAIATPVVYLMRNTDKAFQKEFSDELKAHACLSNTK
mmetsp:Transcript_9788/g.9884  ORF Transcript_9788/g.9884 Transcript_9788/m.9884 type:complete len:86 (-) Transcript_9788:276-533(-)